MLDIAQELKALKLYGIPTGHKWPQPMRKSLVKAVSVCKPQSGCYGSCCRPKQKTAISDPSATCALWVPTAIRPFSDPSRPGRL